MLYELWDTETGNMVFCHAQLDDVVGLLQSSLNAYGPEYVQTMAIVENDDDSRPRLIAEGDELEELVRGWSAGGRNPEPPTRTQPQPSDLHRHSKKATDQNTPQLSRPDSQRT